MMSPLPLVPSLLTILLSLTTLASATTINVVNNCNQPVWAAALPGGGRRLNKGETWTLRPADGTQGARIWGRTNCNFDSNGRGSCQTGDCGGVLDCRVSGANPQTLAEYTLGQTDFFDISLVDGFNLPIAFSPTTGGSGNCRSIQCSADVNGQCPAQLRVPGGCKSACTVFNTNQYCCFNGPQSCGPTPFSQYFKGKCPDAYSYAYDDQTSTFTCPHGTNYRVTFCP